MRGTRGPEPGAQPTPAETTPGPTVEETTPGPAVTMTFTGPPPIETPTASPTPADTVAPGETTSPSPTGLPLTGEPRAGDMLGLALLTLALALGSGLLILRVS